MKKLGLWFKKIVSGRCKSFNFNKILVIIEEKRE
jgi:hypothetical protein